MEVSKFRECFSKLRSYPEPKTDSDWKVTIKWSFDCTDELTSVLYGAFLGFSVFRPAGEGKTYLDHISADNLRDFLSLLG